MKTQLERMAILETQMTDLKRDVCGIKDDVKELKDYVVKAIEEKADKTELDKVNRVIFWAATLIITGFFGIIVYLIQKHII